MNVSFKIILHKEWTLLEDRIIYGDQDILFENIMSVKLIQKGGKGFNGIIHIKLKDKRLFVLAYPMKLRDEGYKAFLYIQENYGNDEEKSARETALKAKIEEKEKKQKKALSKDGENGPQKSTVRSEKTHHTKYDPRSEKKDTDLIHCPKCKGTQISAHKKGFGLGKAVVGTVTFGILAGAGIGMLGKNKVYLSCMRCGYQWKPKK